MPTRKPSVRRKKVTPSSLGLAAGEMAEVRDSSLAPLSTAIERDGGAILARFRDPVGGRPLLLAALPVDRVEPTPFQRDVSDTHVKRLMGVVEKIGLFLDPIIVVHQDAGYWTPNGNHRLQALKKLGFKAVTALVVPDAEVAFKILALNTEKAHNLREKSLETIRMARALADRSDAPEASFAFEFEQPAFLTLGVCYEARPRFSGGAYQSILRRIDAFLDDPIGRALKERGRRGAKVLKLDDAVVAAVEKLKAKGLTSPYLKSFVVARVNYTRFSKATTFDFDEALDRILASAQKFNIDRVRQEDVARAAGGPPDEE
ncbi:MAG TPA: ParB N-terminal domain-containing protein [Vicinamibacterales bacterium]|nr:ParB N-terminal domain-containing protein [Vicinamibacterales bacterium]